MRYVNDRQDRLYALCPATIFAGEFRVPNMASWFMELMMLSSRKALECL